jgi:PAS domain S-box-containing protein
LDLLGAKSEHEVLGRLLWDLVHPDYHATAKERHRQCKSETRIFPLAEFKLIGFDGRMRDIESVCAPLAFNGNLAAMAVWRDISQRKQAENTLHRYQMITDNSRDIVLFMRSSDGRILEANKAASKAYEYSREEMLGLTIHDLRAPETKGIVKEQMSLADSQGILFETLHRTKEGRTFPVEVSSQGATIDGTRTLISVIRDITERQGMRQQLMELDAAVKVILEKNEESKREVEEKVLLRIKDLIRPYLEKLNGSNVSDLQKSYLALIDENLREIVAPFTSFTSVNYYKLTDKEIQISDLIRRGKSTKEIATLLKSSKRAVEFHRNRLREKFGISHQKANLRDFLVNLK